MEEEKTAPKKENELKLYFACYAPQLPSDLVSFLTKNSFENSKNFALIQDQRLELVQTSNERIYLNLYPGENYAKILCKIYEIDTLAFQNFFTSNVQNPDLITNFNDKQKAKEFKCEFQSVETLSKIMLFSVGEYQNFPLISMSYLDTKKIPDIFEEPFSKDLNIFGKLLVFFKEIFDKNAAQLYLRRILFELQNKEKAFDFIENILKEVFPEETEEFVETNEKKLLFLLKTKEFRKEKIFELPKFNKVTGNFENGEKFILKI